MEAFNEVILQPEVTIDAALLCDQLRDKARYESMGSEAVDTIEWQAANVIMQLLRER